jgi:hypothetical protein
MLLLELRGQRTSDETPTKHPTTMLIALQTPMDQTGPMQSGLLKKDKETME